MSKIVMEDMVIDTRKDERRRDDEGLAQAVDENFNPHADPNALAAAEVAKLDVPSRLKGELYADALAAIAGQYQDYT